MNTIIRLSLLFILTVFVSGAYAQMYVQLEITNSLETKKYTFGDVLVYKTTEFPDEWQKGTITGINYENNIIQLNKKMEFISDITHVKVRNPVPFYLSRMLYTFGSVAAVFGGVGDAFRGQLQPQTIIFPVASLSLALVLDKLVSTKVYPLGKRANLRILDLRM
jgi:hypothetical protein